ncbi:MAG: uroporphyrinogen-III synthase [Hyphomicrobiaceae bacterium]
MRLLVTRPEADAVALRAKLTAMGHEVLIAPLLDIRFEPAPDIEAEEVQALIATSRNGVRALAQWPTADQMQDLPLFAVGPGTGSAARALGFRNVIEGPRDASALITLIAMKADVNAEPLVHLAGNVKAVDVAGELRHLGFHVLEPVTYVAAASTEFDPRVVERFRSGQIDGVLLMSPRTARIYVKVLRKHGLERCSSRAVHYCLSQAVADALAGLPKLKIAAASRPNLNEMLALIARTAPQST